jgi:hypothetical protein
LPPLFFVAEYSLAPLQARDGQLFIRAELRSRIGGRIGGIIGSAVKPRTEIGALKFPFTSLYPAEQCWRDKEAELYEKHLNPIIGKDVNNAD